MLGEVGILGKNPLIHFGGCFSPWLNGFIIFWKSIKKTAFFEDQTAAETRNHRAVHPAVQLWTAVMMFVCASGCVCVGCLVHMHMCVYVNVLALISCKCYRIALTSPHWTLAFYTGNYCLYLNLPPPAQVTYPKTCLAAAIPCWLHHCALITCPINLKSWCFKHALS